MGHSTKKPKLGYFHLHANWLCYYSVLLFCFVFANVIFMSCELVTCLSVSAPLL